MTHQKGFQRGTVAPFHLKSTTRLFWWSGEEQQTGCCIRTQLGKVLLLTLTPTHCVSLGKFLPFPGTHLSSYCLPVFSSVPVTSGAGKKTMFLNWEHSGSVLLEQKSSEQPEVLLVKTLLSPWPQQHFARKQLSSWQLWCSRHPQWHQEMALKWGIFLNGRDSPYFPNPRPKRVALEFPEFRAVGWFFFLLFLVLFFSSENSYTSLFIPPVLPSWKKIQRVDSTTCEIMSALFLQNQKRNPFFSMLELIRKSFLLRAMGQDPHIPP